MANILRTHAQVERPTVAQLRAIGMTAATATGHTVYRRPTTFNLTDTKGYFATDIVRRMDEEKELGDRNPYHTSGGRASDPRAGAVPEGVGLPGPPLTPAERRLAGKESPETSPGARIFWDYNYRMGCSDPNYGRPREFYRNYDQLSDALEIALVTRHGFKKGGDLAANAIADAAQALRQSPLKEANRNRAPRCSR